jgi:peptide/nickel transport system ATP-binding protein
MLVMSSTPILKVENLVKDYYVGVVGRKAVRALDGVSITVNEKEFVALVGESGSGKTTLARIILRLTPPTMGKVLYRFKNDDKLVDVMSLSGDTLKRYRAEVQGIFQDPYTSFNPFYKVDRALKVAVRKFLGRNADEDKVIREALTAVRLNPDEVLGRYPHQLSGGQLQRISIARALIPRPRLLIADEYISMVDMSTRADIVNLTRDLIDAYGMSIIMITHEMSTALYASDRTIVLFKGMIVEEGDTKKIMKNPLHPYTQLLIEALPSIEERKERKILAKTIEVQRSGVITQAVRGCPFAPRCPFAKSQCFTTKPKMIEFEKDHHVACWLYT